jgi:hypothetical protein
MPWIESQAVQRVEIAGVGQQIQIDDTQIRNLRQAAQNIVAADEAGTTRHQ